MKTIRIATPLLLTSFLLTILLVSVSGCQVANAQDVTPHLITTIDMPLPGGHGPRKITTLPNGYAYVAVRGVGGSSIRELNGSKILTTILWPPDIGGISVDLIPDPNDDTIYIRNRGANRVNVISGSQIVDHVTDLYFPTDMTIDPERNYMYVTNWIHELKTQEDVSNIVSDIAVISGTEIITRILTQSPQVVKYNPVTKQMLVGLDTIGYTNPEPFLWVLEGTEVVTKTSLNSTEPGRVSAIDINHKTGEVYLLDKGYLVYWDGENETHRVKIGSTSNLAIDPKRGWAYVTRIKKPNLVVVEKDQILAELFTSYDSRELTVDETRDYVYVTNREGLLSVIRGTEVITTMVTGGIGASYIGLAEEQGYIYVSNADSHSIGVFGFEEPQPTFWQQFFLFLVR